MKRNCLMLIIAVITAMTLCACGPSDEKIIEAQNKYRELITIHNDVVAAHSAIKDASLDDELLALEESIPLMEEYNLNDMTDDEIKVLIDSMNNVINSYSTYLSTIGEIQKAEAAAMLTPVYVTLVNNSDITFTRLSLEEKGAEGDVTNVLETLSGLKPSQEIIGLTIYKDVDATPWVLRLSDKDISISEDETASEEDTKVTDSGKSSNDEDTSDEATEDKDDVMNYELEIDVSKYVSDKVTISIGVDEETSELYIE